MSFAARLASLLPALEARAQVLIDRRVFGAGAPLAADLAQTTIAHLLDRAPPDVQAAETERIRMYAFRSLHNVFVDACYRKRRELLAPGDEGLPDIPSAEDDPEATTAARRSYRRRFAALSAALNGLEEEERHFLERCLALGSAPAAQRELGWPPGTAANACKRRNSLLLRLRAQIQAEGRSMTEPIPLRPGAGPHGADPGGADPHDSEHAALLLAALFDDEPVDAAALARRLATCEGCAREVMTLADELPLLAARLGLPTAPLEERLHVRLLAPLSDAVDPPSALPAEVVELAPLRTWTGAIAALAAAAALIMFVATGESEGVRTKGTAPDAGLSVQAVEVDGP